MRKSLRIAVCLPLVAALLGLGAAPAQANGVVLPPNANGTDNSGLLIEACPNFLHMKLPVTPSADANDSALAGMYYNFAWSVEIDGYQTFEANAMEDQGQTSDTEGFSAAITWVADLTDGVDGAEPGDVLDLTLTAKAYDSLGNETVSSNPILLQVSVLDPEGFATGSGTKADPYIITTREELNLVRCTDNKYFELGNSIDLNNESWLPIRGGFVKRDDGIEEMSLSLDGNGHSISNLFVETQAYESGLFGRLQYSLIKDLVIESPEVWGVEEIGALAGDSRYSHFANIKITEADIFAYSGRAGLMIGHSDYRGIFRNCEVDGQLTAESYQFEYEYSPDYWSYRETYNNDFGGMIGYDDGDGSTHENNKSNVTINISIEAADFTHYEDPEPAARYIGGYIGEAGENVMIRNVEATSTINVVSDGFTSYVGGLAGDSEESLFSDSVVNTTINIQSETAGEIGGAVGSTNSTSFDSLEVNADINIYASGYANRIGGFTGDLEYGGMMDIDVDAKIDIVATSELIPDIDLFAWKVGGVVGYTDSGELQNIRGNSEINLLLGDGTNNPANAVVDDATGLDVRDIGGIIGEHDDYSSYVDIESNSAIVIDDFDAVDRIGGGFGNMSDNRSISLNHLVVKGSIAAPSDAHRVGGLIGALWAGANIINVIVAVNVAENVGMTGVGPILGGYGDDDESNAVYSARTYSHNLFWDSSVETMANNFDEIGASATTAELSDVAWLTANQFDTTRFWKVEGSYPTLRLTLGTPVASFVKFGQANKKLTLVFSPVKKGKRTFKINLASTLASKKIKLVVIRGGVKVKTIKLGQLDILGDRKFKSKVKLKKGDKLQVKIGKKIVARHTVR